MDYHKCSHAELVKFVADRGLDPPIPTKRSALRANWQRFQYIAVLRAADARLRFRFLGLYPELRNRIYTELLQIKTEEERGCWPNILATCKQIHNEASGVLYGDNRFHITLGCSKVYFQDHQCGNLFSCRFDWPDFLHRVRNLSFHIINHRFLRDDKLRDHIVGRVLYHLCTHLHKRNKLQSLTIDVHYAETQVDNPNPQANDQSDPFRPSAPTLAALRLLRTKAINITILGATLPEGIVLDPITGAHRDAAAADEARALLFSAIKSFQHDFETFRQAYTLLETTNPARDNNWWRLMECVDSLNLLCMCYANYEDEALMHDDHALRDYAATVRAAMDLVNFSPFPSMKGLQDAALMVMKAGVELQAFDTVL